MFYRVFNCLSEISQELLSSFSELDRDEYLKEDWCYRYRAYGEASISSLEVEWDSITTFYQSDAVNSYAGSQVRTFAELPDVTQRFAEGVIKDKLIDGELNRAQYRVGCHQIRICADDAHNGLPTPEGFHQDGFDFVVVNCINQYNVNGGATLICHKNSKEDILFDRQMLPGESLLINDRELMHYVSPITPKRPGFACRDVVVITFEK